MMLKERREQYKESLRQEILDVARVLFANEGYEATSIRKIADKAGCSPGIIYHYFEDKEAMMAGIVSETFRKMIAQLEAQVSDEAPIVDRLRRGLRAYIEFALAHPNHYELLFKKRELSGSERLMEVFQTDGHRAFGCMQRMCDEAMERGVIREEITDNRELAQSLWVMVHGVASAQIGAKGFPFVEQTRLVERCVDVLMLGVLRSAAAEKR